MALSKIHVVCQVHGEGDRAKISRDADQDVVVIHPAPPSFRDEQRLRFDLCFGDGATPDDVFFETEMHILADAVSLGYNAGLFVTGIGGDFQNRSTHYFTKIVDILKEYHDDLENPSISFCQIGVPSSRVIDLVNEKVLPGDAKHLEEEWVNLLKPISDYDEISNVLSKGCSIPNIVAIRIETKGRTSGTVGTLFLVDLGLPVVTSILNQPRPASKSHSQCGGACVDPSLSFSGSFSGIAKLVSFLTTSHYEGAIPVAQDPFTAICSELFGGNGITKVVVHLDALAEDVSTVSAALRLSSSMRRVRNRPVVNHTDPRLFELATRCEGVENERDLLQRQRQEQQSQLNRQNNVLGYLENMYRREMDRARQWEKDLEDELAAVVDRTETEMRETVCKHEQRQAELARNLYEMNLKLAVLTDERDAALAELNEERENGKFALATMSSERERLQRELAISIEEYVREREGLRRQLSKNSEDAQTRETELLEHHRLAIADLKSKLESQAARKLKEETERFNSEAARQLTQQRKELERGHEAAIQSERKSAEERLAKALEREAEKFDTKLKEHLKGQEKDIRKELNAERRIVEREKDVEVDQERRYAREQREAIEREVGLRKELEEKLKAEREQTRKAEAKARELDEAKSELEADLHRLQSKAQRRENALQSENEQISATCRDLEEKIKQLRVELRVLRSQAAEVPNQSIPTMVTAIQRSRSPVNDDVRRAHVLPFPEEPHLDEPTSEPEQSFRKLPSNPRKKDANGQKAQSASTAAPKKTQSRKKKVESAENDNQGDAGEEEEIELAATSEEHTKAIGKRADAEEAVGRTDESRRKKTKQNGSKSDQAAAKAAQTRPAQSNKRKAVEVESEDERVARDDDEIEVSDDDDERAVRRPKRAARKNGEERRRAAPNSPSTQDDVRAEGPTHIDASEKEKIQKKKKDAQKKGLPRAEEAPANECYGDQAPVDIPSKRKAAEAKKPRAPAKSLAKKFAREDQENQQQADPDRTDDESDAEIGRSGPSRAEDPSVILETQREQVVEETQVEEYAPITAVSRRTNGRVVQETENGGERSIEKRKKNEGSKNLPVRDENEGDEGFEDAGVKKKAPVRKAKAKVPELAESDGEAENAPRVIKAKPKATKSTRGKAPEARSRVVAREQGGSDGANEDGAQATKKRKLNHTFLTKAGAAGRPALDFSSLRAAGIGIQSGPAGGLLQQPPPPSWLGFLQKTKTIPGAANE